MSLVSPLEVSGFPARGISEAVSRRRGSSKVSPHHDHIEASASVFIVEIIFENE